MAEKKYKLSVSAMPKCNEIVRKSQIFLVFFIVINKGYNNSITIVDQPIMTTSEE